MPIDELLTLPYRTLQLYRVYELMYGLPTDRLTGAVAIGSSGVMACLGNKVDPSKLLPHYQDAEEDIDLQLSAWAASHNSRRQD